MSVIDDSLGPTSDSFWEIRGYEAAVRRQEDGAKLCDQLMSLIQERADIEKGYAKSLQSWSKKFVGLTEKGPEYGTTEAAWKGVLHEAESIASIHSNIRENLLSEVNSKIKDWKQNNFKKALVGQCKETKHLEEEFKKAQKPWHKKYSKVKETRKQFHMSCKAEKSVTNQENNARADSSLSADQLRKIQEKGDKSRKDVESTKQKYEAALTDLNSYNAKYIEDMSMVYQKSDENEERRLVFFKEMLFGIHKCLNISVVPDIPQIYNQLHHTIDQADYTKDLRWWSQMHGKDMSMNWPQFEEYQEGHHQISRKEKKGHVGHSDGITLTSLKTDNNVPLNTYQNPASSNGSAGSVSNTPPHASPNIQRTKSYDATMNPFGADDLEGDDLETDSQSTFEGAAISQQSTPVKSFDPPVHSTPTINIRQSETEIAQPSTCDSLADKSSSLTPEKSASKRNSILDYDDSLNPFGDDDEIDEQDDDCDKKPEDEIEDGEEPKDEPKDEEFLSARNSPSPDVGGVGSKTAPPRPPPPRPPRVDRPVHQNQNPFGDDEFDDEDEQVDTSGGSPVRAIYEYVGQEEDELSFKEGEVFMKLRDRDAQGWCTGLKDGKVGLYPDNYVQSAQ